jgi:uncharacterized protein (TIGR03000 family)
MSGPSIPFLKKAAFLTVAFLVATPQVLAQDGRGFRDPKYSYPWQAPGYRGYQEPSVPWYAKPLPERYASPGKYQVTITILPAKQTEGDPHSVLLVAHLPETAQIWFDDAPTQQGGTLRQFVTPPLTPGKEYGYAVRVRWYEDGQWVSQVHHITVHAGDLQCIDIIPSNSQVVQEKVATNLAKLNPEERKSAEAQRFCAVQEGIRLGSMGVPVKVTLKGQDVFLCCEACMKKAQSNPDQTLERVQKLKAKGVAASSP